MAPAAFTVNTVADILIPPVGTVTLRSAITQANRLGGTNTISLPAAALGVSTSTVEKDWAYARSWLRMAIDRISGQRP